MRPPNTVLRRLARGGRPVTLIAIVALLLGGAGVSQTAWAKALINGKDIKKGTVTGKQVKDGSIGLSDLARSARTELAGKPGVVGATGAAGPSGPQGAAGQAGPAGPQGERGAQGIQGAPGPKGEDGRDAASQWVRVSRSGVVVASSLPAPTIAEESGSYRVSFDRNVSGCGTTVTRHADPIADGELVTTGQLDLQAAGRAFTYTEAASASSVHVRLIDHAAANGADLAPGAFTLTLHC